MRLTFKRSVIFIKLEINFEFTFIRIIVNLDT